MASSAQPNRVVLDVGDCIAELRSCFLASKSPINDDCSVLHRLEEKLELTLQHGLKEKPGLIGAKRSYWSYVCACYYSSKKTHEGLKFVKSIQELKTSLGRGRAFIRFCLMQKCLADTLQSCFINLKITRDFYWEKSVPFQSKLWSDCITFLYDLNDINFDLPLRHVELDVSWPSFARKIFISPEKEVLPVGNDITSTNSFSTKNNCDLSLLHGSEDSHSKEDDFSQVKEKVEKLREINAGLSNDNSGLLKEMQFIMEQKSELETSIQHLEKKCLSLQNERHAEVEKVKEEAEKLQKLNEILSKENHALRKEMQSVMATASDFEKNRLSMRNKEFAKLEEMHDENAVKNLIQDDYEEPDNKEGERTRDLQLILLQAKNNELLQEIYSYKNSIPGTCINCKRFQKSLHSSSEDSDMSSHLLQEHNLIHPSSIVHNAACDAEQSQSTSEVKVYSNEITNPKLNMTWDSDIYYPQSSDTINRMQNECTAIQHNVSSFKLNDLLTEMKVLYEDLGRIVKYIDKPLVLPHLSRLEVMRKCIETFVLTEVKSMEEYENEKQWLEKAIFCMKKMALKQDGVISKLQTKVNSLVNGNKDLHFQICTLKDLLHSCGLLKVHDRNNFNLQNRHLIVNDSDLFLSASSEEDITCDTAYFEPVLNNCIESLFQIFKTSSSKLTDLNMKVTEVQRDLLSSQDINNNLISTVREQEVHLKGVTKELEEIQQLVSVMKEQHHKLQSSEGILKYDLKEKRKLLTRLKEQLEMTREDWKRVRLKNSKSEVEWKNLREEFMLRQKQTSEESGFVDDKGMEEQNNVHMNTRLEYNFNEKSTSEQYVEAKISETKSDHDESVKKSRLEILEEQCHLLHSNLLHSSKKRQEIHSRLESMCKAGEKSRGVRSIQKKSSSEIPTNTSKFSNTSVDVCDGETNAEYFANSPESSEIGSLNSDMSLFAPRKCLTNSRDTSGSLESLSSDACASSNSSAGLSQSLEAGGVLGCTSDKPISYITGHSDSCAVIQATEKMYPCEQTEPFKSDETADFGNVTFSQLTSMLIKKNSLEESLRHLTIQEESLEHENSTCMETKDLRKQILSLEVENRFLENKVQELEKQVLSISTLLDQTTQQLMVTKAAKEHEVSALKFQLNTEALKYEKALKEFSDQNSGLESMKQKVSDQEKLIFALEEALSEIRIEREGEKEHQWQELQDIQLALTAREDECVSLYDDLEKSMTNMEEERNKNDLLISQLENLRTHSQQDRDALETELIHLQNDSRVLRKKLVKLLKDKDILWKRNDHLSYLQKVKIDDRWLDDHEVSNCLGCKRTFSFLVRKHHCRLCGRIFCHSCSNNWLLTASSRKRTRVCNECYIQHMEVSKDVRKGSGFLCIEDDSEDEAVDDISFNPTSNSSLISEIPTSIADSVASLPVIEVDSRRLSLPLFASAPDLRCDFKHEEFLTRPKSMVYENVMEEPDEKTILNDSCLEDKHTFQPDDKNTCTVKKDIDELPSGVHTVQTVSTNDIEASQCGITGELIVEAGGKVVVPVVCEKCPIEIFWSLSSISEDIAVSLLHEDSGKFNGQPTVFYHSENEKEGVMQLSLPGLYTFHFDNSSRAIARNVLYTLKVKYQNESVI